MMHGMIEDRTAKLAYDISRDYAGKRPHLLCVLKVFLCDFAKRIQNANNDIGCSYFLLLLNSPSSNFPNDLHF